MSTQTARAKSRHLQHKRSLDRGQLQLQEGAVCRTDTSSRLHVAVAANLSTACEDVQKAVWMRIQILCCALSAGTALLHTPHAQWSGTLLQHAAAASFLLHSSDSDTALKAALRIEELTPKVRERVAAELANDTEWHNDLALVTLERLLQMRIVVLDNSARDGRFHMHWNGVTHRLGWSPLGSVVLVKRGQEYSTGTLVCADGVRRGCFARTQDPPILDMLRTTAMREL